MIEGEGFTTQLLYVGADQHFASQLADTVERKAGWSLRTVVDVDTALAVQSEQNSAVAVLLVKCEFSLAQSLRFLRTVDRRETPAIIVFDQLDARDVLELLRNGAVECLGRPVNLTRLSLVMDMLSVPRHAGNAKPKLAVHAEGGQATGWHDRLMDQVRSVASLSTTVLITGETGTGKTRLSRLIHGLSPRKDKPFLAVNCGALSESLLDSELFGHVRGAFTGADQDYAGKLTQCQDGTLLLDEVDTLSPTAQVKLLQVVEDRVFQPVGSANFLPLQARLIVASNRPLEHEVAEGRFRSDLYYRLNVMAFQLPPLRMRRQEIGQLANKFAAEFTQHHGFPATSIAAEAMMALESYRWPGNIRELRNVMERAIILAAGTTIEASHLPQHVVQAVHRRDTSPVNCDDRPCSSNKLADARVEAERELLLSALLRNDNNRSRTATDLGISRVALYKRLRKLQIS